MAPHAIDVPEPFERPAALLSHWVRSRVKLPTVNRTLRAPVQDFINAVAPLLAELGSDDPTSDATTEAYNIVCAMIDSDGLHTDEELWALIGAFSGMMDTHIHHATPTSLRGTGMVNGKRVFVETPSLLFDTFIAADRKNETSSSWTYYTQAMRLAHFVIAVDDMTQHGELQTVERFRQTLLGALTDAGLPRGSQPPKPQKKAATATGNETTKEEAQPKPVQEPARPLEELLDELDQLVGLDAVKTEVRLVVNLIQVRALREEAGLKVSDSSRHLVFTGNPGTGKTTVARLIAQIYRTLEVVPTGHLVETDRSGLVTGFVGQTATNVKAVFDRAKGGVLLIDEAYSLLRGGEKDFGREAIDAIVKLVEDRRDDTVVIMAGYPGEMAELMEANPGLRSRFPQTIHFPDYTTSELVKIAELIAGGNDYSFDDGAKTRLGKLLDSVSRDRGFGNGRLARNLFEAAVARHATRMVEIDSPDKEQLSTLTAEDLPDEVVDTLS